MIRHVAFALALCAAPISAEAHQLVVFASVDCETVTVEAKFSSGRVAQTGEVRVLNSENTLQTTVGLMSDGTARIPLAELDHGAGLLVEVDTGGHDNYWIITPEDIARKCAS